MATEIPRPGVQVVQVFRSVSPTIITPTLVPNIVGVAREIIEVYETDSAGNTILNPDALITLPALFEAPDAPGGVYSGLEGKSLVVSLNNGPLVTIPFSDPTLAGLPPSSVVSQIRDAFTAAGVTAATAETVGDTRWRMRSIGVGEFQTIYIDASTDPAVLSAFDLNAGYTYTGVGSYQQYGLQITPSSFPDPRGNLDEIVPENGTIRIFMALGGTAMKEALRDEAFLRRSADDYAAQIVGTVDLTTLTYGGGGTVDGDTLVISTDAAAPQTVTFSTPVAPTSASDVLDRINDQTTGLIASMDISNQLVLTSITQGPGSSVQIVGDTGGAIADLGLEIVTGVPEFAVGGPETPAQVVGTVDLATLLPWGGGTLVVGVNGATPLSLTLVGPLATVGAIIAEINTKIQASAIGYDLVATVMGSNYLVLTTPTLGDAASIELDPTSTVLTALGLTATTTYGEAVLAAIDDGNGDAVTPLVKAVNEDFTAAAVAAEVTGTVDLDTLTPGAGGTLDGKTLILSDGGLPQTITFAAPQNPATNTDIIDQIEAIVGAPAGLISASFGGNNELILSTAPVVGSDASIRIVGGTAVADLGLTEGLYVGSLGGALAGDALWIDGVLLGLITEVAPGGQTDVLKIDSQIPIDASLGESFFIIAKDLPDTNRPAPELVVDNEGVVNIKANLIRDTRGAVIVADRPIYMAYNAIRQDVSPLAADAGLLTLDDTTQLTDQLSPISTDNPLALGMYFALINAPGVQVTGLGVDAVSADQPNGTTEAFTRAAEFLEAYEVYAIALLTHDVEVFQVFQAHVGVMSEPEYRGERIVLINPEMPSRAVDSLVASGTDGDSSGVTGTQFDTKVANLGALLLLEDIDPTGTLPVDDGVFLDIASDGKSYSVKSVTGSVVTVRTSSSDFAPGENDDNYYATSALNDPPLPSTLISETFSIKIRGAVLENTDGTPDKTAVAETYNQMGAGYGDRRVWQIIPDQCVSTVGGIEQVIDGFYMCAAISGMIGQYPPQQSFTNLPMTGFTQVMGSNDYFSERQMNVIAGGGNWLVIQEGQDTPLFSRHALTTNVTSIETRTDSITKVVDYTSKLMRRSLRNFIGRFNITAGFMDTLGNVIQGVLGFLENLGVLLGSDLNNIIQDEDAPDTVLVDITLDVPYPCNYIRVTLVI